MARGDSRHRGTVLAHLVLCTLATHRPDARPVWWFRHSVCRRYHASTGPRADGGRRVAAAPARGRRPTALAGHCLQCLRGECVGLGANGRPGPHGPGRSALSVRSRGLPLAAPRNCTGSAGPPREAPAGRSVRNEDLWIAFTQF